MLHPEPVVRSAPLVVELIEKCAELVASMDQLLFTMLGQALEKASPLAVPVNVMTSPM